MKETNYGTSAERDLRILFARQLHQSCRERLGEDHPQTRLALTYLFSFTASEENILLDPLESARARVPTPSLSAC